MPLCRSEYRLTIFLGNIITLEDVGEWGLLVELNDGYRKSVLQRLRLWSDGFHKKQGVIVNIWPERAGIAMVVEISCSDEVSPKSWQKIKKKVAAIIANAEKRTRKKGEASGASEQTISLGAISCV